MKHINNYIFPIFISLFSLTVKADLTDSLNDIRYYQQRCNDIQSNNKINLYLDADGVDKFTHEEKKQLLQYLNIKAMETCMYDAYAKHALNLIKHTASTGNNAELLAFIDENKPLYSQETLETVSKVNSTERYRLRNTAPFNLPFNLQHAFKINGL